MLGTWNVALASAQMAMWVPGIEKCEVVRDRRSLADSIIVLLDTKLDNSSEYCCCISIKLRTRFFYQFLFTLRT